MPSLEHVLLLATPRSRRLDQALGHDRDHDALTGADAALALRGCRPLPYAALRWRVNGDQTSLELLRPSLLTTVRHQARRRPSLLAEKLQLIADLALVAERRALALAVVRSVLADPERLDVWRKHIQPLYGAACWQLEYWYGEAWAIARERLEDF